MKRKNTNVLLIFGVVIAIILLMIWLFLGTTLEQEANPETDPMTVEQKYLIFRNAMPMQFRFHAHPILDTWA